MPGFLSAFSATARRAFPIIQRGVTEGLSGNRIIEVLKGSNLSFRRQSMLELIRLERGNQRSFATLRNLRREFRPTERSLREAAGRIRRQFSFTVELRGDIDTEGFLERRHITISTNQLMTRAELEESALGTHRADNYRDEFEAREAILISGVKAGAAGFL